MGLEAAAGLLACPYCGGVLVVSGTSVRCPAGHAFDVARQGYVNLMNGPEPANADTAAMLAARGRVLASGLFDPLAEVVAEVGRGERVLEVGSGTAFYLRACLGKDPQARGIALDVSRAAGRAAARVDPRVAAVVADVWRRLPLRDRCLDTVVAVFAPRNLSEFARVLSPSGRLVVATPESAHLAEVRQRYGLLDVKSDKAGRLASAAAEFFRGEATHVVRRRSEAGPELVRDLIAMGPNAFHGLPSRVEAAPIQLDVRVQVFVPLA